MLSFDSSVVQHLALIRSCRSLRKWFTWVMFAMLFVDAPVWAGSSDAELKAAYIVRFTEFIDWPGDDDDTSNDDSTNASFVICVLGESPIETPLARLPELIKVHSRPINVRRRITVDEIKDCDILFVPAHANHFLSLIHERLENKPTLVVNEIPSNPSKGQLITLYTEDDRLRFDVHLKLAKQAGFKLSSRLLKLARVVE